MTDDNLCKNQKAQSQHEEGKPKYKIAHVALGQKLLIFALGVYVLSIIVQFLSQQIAGILGIASLILAIPGIIKLSKGLKYGIAAAALYIIGMIIPAVGAIVLLVLIDKATRVLKENGYRERPMRQRTIIFIVVAGIALFSVTFLPSILVLAQRYTSTPVVPKPTGETATTFGTSESSPNGRFQAVAEVKVPPHSQPTDGTVELRVWNEQSFESAENGENPFIFRKRIPAKKVQGKLQFDQSTITWSENGNTVSFHIGERTIKGDLQTKTPLESSTSPSSGKSDAEQP